MHSSMLQGIVTLTLALFALLRGCEAVSTTGSRLLAVIDQAAQEQGVATYVNSFRDRGYDVVQIDPKTSSASLFEYDERKFDHVLILAANSKSLGADITAQTLVKFVNAGGNVLCATTEQTPEAVRELGAQIGVTYAPRGSVLADHFSHAQLSSDTQHRVILTTGTTDNVFVYPEAASTAPVKYSGTAQRLSNSPLLLPLLRAERTAYVYDPDEDIVSVPDPFVAGTQAFLATGFQALNGARVVLVGSVSMFSDANLDDKALANADFTQGIGKWALQESGVLRATTALEHHKLGSSELNPRMYRIKDVVEFRIGLSGAVDGKWVPYEANDVQLELIMLDPYVRQTMKLMAGDATTAYYRALTMLPDHHGVFTFRVHYQRPGLSVVDVKDVVTLRHFWHNEYPRFLSAAWPYYVATASVSVAFSVFVVLWLFHVDTEQRKVDASKKEQ